MKHIIKLNVDSIAFIEACKKASLAHNEASAYRNAILSSIKLPSGRTRNGGKKDLADAEQKLDLARKEYFSMCDLMRSNLRKDILVERRDNIYDALNKMLYDTRCDVTKDVLLAARTCFVERFIQKVKVGDYTFDVMCDLEYDGVAIHISPEGEGRSLGGGMVTIRRKHGVRYNIELDKELERITSASIVDDELHVELPDEYKDGGYTINIKSRDEVDAQYARTMFFLFNSCVDITNGFNCHIIESGLSHSMYKVL
jgi:hypothetical protein